MAHTPLSYHHDLTRAEIVERFRERIGQGKRNKLGSNELGQLIQYFIAALQELDTQSQIKALCAAEIALLEEGYKQNTVAFDYLPKYRKAIEAAIADGTLPTTPDNSHRYLHTQRVTGIESERSEHYALTYLKYDTQTYESLDSRSQQTNRHHQLNLKFVNPQRYLEELAALLHSDHKFAARHQAIAIAGLTGRRIGEVLARGRFSLTEHPYLLKFEGHSKTDRQAYNVVTLMPAEQLLPSIEQFRGAEEIVPLLNLEGEALNQALNKLDVQVNRECKRYLGEIVPPLEDREGVSVHNLHSLWGAISAYFFCPPNQHEYPFLQHYLGHVIESSATGHYFRYRLVDEAGKLLEDRGIKIASVGGLPLPNSDQQPEPEPVLDIQEPVKAISFAEDTVSQLSVEAIALAENTIPESSGAELTEEEGDSLLPELTIVRPPQPRHRTKKLLVDCDQLKSVAQKFGICVHGGRGQGYELALAQLLAQLETKEAIASPPLTTEPPLAIPEPAHVITQTVADQARTLAWLTGRIEALETEVTQLRQERDVAIAQVQQLPSPDPELEQLKLDYTNLAEQLATAEAKLQGFRQLLDGDQTPAPVAVAISPSPATAVATPTPLAVTSKPRRSGGAKDRANRIFTAIQQWNQAHPEQTFAVNADILEKAFGINRKAAKEFVAENSPAIAEHHSTVGVDNERTHNRGKDVSQLKSFVDAANNAHSLPSKDSVSDLIEQAIQAIMDYNNYSATEKNQKWAITPDAVVRLSGSDLDSVMRFLQGHHLAISDHHAKHELSPNHNNSHSKKEQQIQQLIHL